MPDQKITELDNYVGLDNSDVLPIVDVSANRTKKVTLGHLREFSHGTFSHSLTLTVAATNTAYPVVYDTQDDLFDLTHTVGDSKVYVPTKGDYLIAVSAVIDITALPSALCDLWLRVNGNNVARSNTQVQINAAAVLQTLAVTFISNLNADDYFELYYHSDSTKTQIVAVAAQVGPPVIPACPSIIVSVVKVSAGHV